jgi:hypothetical protein
MSFNPSAFLPSTCCMSLTAVVGLLATDRKMEAALVAAVCFLSTLGLAVSADQFRKEARMKARLHAWPTPRKHWVDTGMV